MYICITYVIHVSALSNFGLMIILFPGRRDVRQTNEGLPVSPQGATIAQEILYRNWGFSLGRYRSNIPNAGQGVHVVKGCIKAGQITSMYPGMCIGFSILVCVSFQV